MQRLINTFLILVFSMLSPVIFAKYVSDVLYIPVRTGPSSDYRIIGYLKSGTPVESTKTQGEYTHINSSGQKEYTGWVKERFLVSEPIAAFKLKELKADLEKIDSIKSDLSKSQKDVKTWKQSTKKLEAQLNQIKETSAHVIQIGEENTTLKKQVKTFQDELNKLKKANLLLEQNQKNEGIKLGLLAVVIGVLAGFILPYIKPRSHKSRNQGIRLR